MQKYGTEKKQKEVREAEENQIRLLKDLPEALLAAQDCKGLGSCDCDNCDCTDCNCGK